MSKPKVCKECGAPPTNGYHLNRRGHCINCTVKHVSDCIHQLHAHEGEYYQKWQAAMLSKIDRIAAGVKRS